MRWSGSCSSTQMASVDVSRAATRGLPALKSALCALAKFALPSPSLLHNPIDWPSMIAEVVQDAFAGLAAGQDEVAKGALSLAVQMARQPRARARRGTAGRLGA